MIKFLESLAAFSFEHIWAEYLIKQAYFSRLHEFVAFVNHRTDILYIRWKQLLDPCCLYIVLWYFETLFIFSVKHHDPAI